MAAATREQILNLDVNDELVEQYLIEQMQLKHKAAVAERKLEAALKANDQLHQELADVAKAQELARNSCEADVVPGDVMEEAEEEAEAPAAPKKGRSSR